MLKRAFQAWRPESRSPARCSSCPAATAIADDDQHRCVRRIVACPKSILFGNNEFRSFIETSRQSVAGVRSAFVMSLVTLKELRIGFRGPPLLDGVSCQIET